LKYSLHLLILYNQFIIYLFLLLNLSLHALSELNNLKNQKRTFNVYSVRIAHPYTYTDAKKPLKRLEYFKNKDIWKGIETNFWKYPSNYPSKSPLLPFHYFILK